jgi:hypothetical protein
MTQPPDSQDNQSDKSARSPDAERQFVQRLLKAFIQWSPLGGSGWIFITFWLRQDLMLTLLMFPAIAVTAVWAAWSKNFITQLEVRLPAFGWEPEKMVCTFGRGATFGREFFYPT